MKSIIFLALALVACSQFTFSDSKATEEEVLAYWTPERLFHTKPMPLPVVRDDTSRPHQNLTKATGVVQQAYSTYPYKTEGKMFFSTGSSSASCSATAIGGNLVLTAGHCVHAGSGGFYTNIIFIPQYKDGVAPIGNWVAQRTWTTSQWASGGGRAFGRDVAVFKVATRLGRTLEMGLGARMTPVYNQARSFNAMALGYPSNIANGRQMVASTGVTTDGHTSYAPATLKIPSTMTYGASGGGWMDLTLVKSVNSYITSSGGYIYGPYFDNTIRDLINNAAAN